MSQLSLASLYQPAHLASEVWAERLEAIRTAVNHLGVKAVAAECDVAPSTLCDALNERDRKRFAGEWIDVVLAMLDRADAPHLAMPLFELQARLVRGFHVTYKPAPRDPKEELAELRAAVGRLAPAVLELAETEMRRRG